MNTQTQQGFSRLTLYAFLFRSKAYRNVRQTKNPCGEILMDHWPHWIEYAQLFMNHRVQWGKLVSTYAPDRNLEITFDDFSSLALSLTHRTIVFVGDILNLEVSRKSNDWLFLKLFLYVLDCREVTVTLYRTPDNAEIVYRTLFHFK